MLDNMPRRKQVLVQLDEELVGRLDELAGRLGTSRSDLIRRGAGLLLDADRVAAADRALQEAYRRQPQDPDLVAASHRLAAETVPPW